MTRPASSLASLLVVWRCTWNCGTDAISFPQRPAFPFFRVISVPGDKAVTRQKPLTILDPVSNYFYTHFCLKIIRKQTCGYTSTISHFDNFWVLESSSCLSVFHNILTYKGITEKQKSQYSRKLYQEVTVKLKGVG